MRDAELAEVLASCARIVDAADGFRCGIERELHDGAQQRLASVVLALGLAGRELTGDAADLVAEARSEAGLAMAELRELARDIYPVLLAEAGLRPALASLTDRCPVPLDGPLGEEPGWRAYALPTPQRRWAPLRAGAILGVFVATWHLPLVAAGSLTPFGIPVTFAITLVYVWLFNRGDGSALLSLVFHVAQGTISYATLGFTGADAARMNWLTGTLWCVIAVGLVTLDRTAWRTTPSTKAHSEVEHAHA